MSDPDQWTAAAIAVQTAWAEAFAARDPDRLAALYTEDTAFFGSTAALHKTRDGVRGYFADLPASYERADFGAPHVVRLGSDALAASGEVVFYTRVDGALRPRPYRMTHVLVRQDRVWRIAAHHASPRP